MKRQRGFKLLPYCWAAISVAAATYLATHWLALSRLHSLAPFTVAVVMIAWYFGLAPSLVTIVLSSLSFCYFIAPPTGWSMVDPQDRVRLAAFILICCLFCFLHAARVRAEVKARTNLQRLSLALEGSKVGLWDLTLASGIVWHSQSLEEIFERHGDRFAHSYEVLLGYVFPSDRDMVHRVITQTIETGGRFDVQYRISLPNGQTRLVGTRGRVFLDSGGRPERLVGTTVDLSHPGGGTLPAGPDSLLPSAISTVPAPVVIPPATTVLSVAAVSA
ncbi:MAG TPA: PAS domain-containing protein [Tepidisphaeraceae bacterium]|nr:PAS domain-containing protein [Tepidisphaeraceae bacterium]